MQCRRDDDGDDEDVEDDDYERGAQPLQCSVGATTTATMRMSRTMTMNVERNLCNAFTLAIGVCQGFSFCNDFKEYLSGQRYNSSKIYFTSNNIYFHNSS